MRVEQLLDFLSDANPSPPAPTLPDKDANHSPPALPLAPTLPDKSAKRVAVGSLGLSGLAALIAVASAYYARQTWYYQFILDDAKLVAHVYADNYLELGSSSFELTFALFAQGNKAMLVRDVGIVEVLNADKKPKCNDRELSKTLSTELLGGKNRIIPHRLGDGSRIFLPVVSKYSVNEQPQLYHSF